MAALVGTAIVVAGLIPASTAASAPRGLVAAYGFEEGSGSQVADASGYDDRGVVVVQTDFAHLADTTDTAYSDTSA